MHQTSFQGLGVFILVILVMTLQGINCQENVYTTTTPDSVTELITMSPLFVSDEVKPPQNKTVLVIVPDEVSDIEFITMVSVLRKAMLKVLVVGEYSSLQNTVSESNIIYLTEMKLTKAVKFAPFDAVVVPGGNGHVYIANNKLCVKTIHKHLKKKKYVVLMSTAPRILAINKIGQGRMLTCHKSQVSHMIKDYEYIKSNKVIIDGNLITTPGPGYAIDCALLLVEKLIGREVADEMSRRLIYTH